MKKQDLFKWEKLGRVFNPAEAEPRPWMKEFAQGPCVLEFERFIRVYYSCRPPANSEGQYTSYSAFVDLNREDLFEILNIAADPILKLGDTGTFDEFGTYPVSVIREGDKVVAYYGGWTRCESVPFNVAIGRAVSYDDGVTFTKTGPGPVLSYDPWEPFVLSGPKIRKFNNTFYLWYIAGEKWILADGRREPVYKIRMASSEDGINWHRIHNNLIESKLEDEAQASPDVIYKNGRYHMFFCYRHGSGYRGKERGYRLGYAFSEDMKTWIRNDSKVGIDVSEDGWDSEMISYPHVFELDGIIYMFYLGNQVGRYGFGLARLNGDLD